MPPQGLWDGERETASNLPLWPLARAVRYLTMEVQMKVKIWFQWACKQSSILLLTGNKLKPGTVHNVFTLENIKSEMKAPERVSMLHFDTVDDNEIIIILDVQSDHIDMDLITDIMDATAQVNRENFYHDYGTGEIMCNMCNGSGEGQHDGTTCRACKGKGSFDYIPMFPWLLSCGYID